MSTSRAGLPTTGDALLSRLAALGAPATALEDISLGFARDGRLMFVVPTVSEYGFTHTRYLLVDEIADDPR